MRIDWVLLDRTSPDCVHVGDLICADAGGLPTYRVLALDDGRVRLRDEQHQAEQVSPLSRFRWKARALAS